MLWQSRRSETMSSSALSSSSLTACPRACLHSLHRFLRVSKSHFDHFNSLIKLTGPPEKMSFCTKVDVEVTLRWPDIYGVAGDWDDSWSRMSEHRTKKVESACKNNMEVQLSWLSSHSPKVLLMSLRWMLNQNLLQIQMKAWCVCTSKNV